MLLPAASPNHSVALYIWLICGVARPMNRLAKSVCWTAGPLFLELNVAIDSGADEPAGEETSGPSVLPFSVSLYCFGVGPSLPWGLHSTDMHALDGIRSMHDASISGSPCLAGADPRSSSPFLRCASPASPAQFWPSRITSRGKVDFSHRALVDT
jgi:hypothetical protein